MDQISFNDIELQKLRDVTGLSKLELLGVIAEINKLWTPKLASRRQYEEDERMGRNI